MTHKFNQDTDLPLSLPVPIDDGACTHLLDTQIPTSLTLTSTSGTSVTPSTLPGLIILFCYPRTGGPNEAVSSAWTAMPGARGCTSQACSFRDHFLILQKLGVQTVFGVSTQTTTYQMEAKERLALPYDLLSDENLEFVKAMGLPTFEWEGSVLMKRCTLAVRKGKVVKVWYPVFPPDENCTEVAAWLEKTGMGG